jgi:hypothetical protein
METWVQLALPGFEDEILLDTPICTSCETLDDDISQPMQTAGQSPDYVQLPLFVLEEPQPAILVEGQIHE